MICLFIWLYEHCCMMQITMKMLKPFSFSGYNVKSCINYFETVKDDFLQFCLEILCLKEKVAFYMSLTVLSHIEFLYLQEYICE
jgi:hypothetical protein